MKTRRLPVILRRLEEVVTAEETSGPSDTQLLARFADQHEEAAFDTLVRRHAALVYRVCRGVLGHHDAEDAVQATFLVLARKAASIRAGTSLRGWLYRVAWRVALRARGSAPRPTLLGVAQEQLLAPAEGDEASRSEFWAVLHDEVGRLSEKYRAAFVLCYLAGKSTEEAARQLGCPRGTVLSRLAAARERLRRRLAGRGVLLSASALAAVLSASAAEAGPSAWLLRSTIRAATAVAAGHVLGPGVVSPRAVSLMEGVVRSMFLSKLKTVAVMLAAAVVIALGIGPWLNRSATAEAVNEKKPTRAAVGQTGSMPFAAEDSAAAQPAEARVITRQITLPIGTWEKKIPGLEVTIRFEADRLHMTVSLTDDKEPISVHVVGDYGINKQGLVLGTISSVDFSGKGTSKENANDLFKTILLAQQANDHPFCFGFVADKDALVIKNVKIFGNGLGKLAGGDGKDGLGEEIADYVSGTYKRVRGQSQASAE